MKVSIRDYFAARALQGMLANPNMISAKSDGSAVSPANPKEQHEAYVYTAFLIADLMLEERGE